MSLKEKYNRQPNEKPKKKGNNDVLSQLMTEKEDNTKKDKKQLAFFIDAELHKRIRTYAALNDTTMITIITNALTEHMDKLEKQN